MNIGDTFFEENEGNVTIGGVIERTYACAKRTVVYTTALPDIYWDKATGVLVEASYSAAEYVMIIQEIKQTCCKLNFGFPSTQLSSTF